MLSSKLQTMQFVCNFHNIYFEKHSDELLFFSSPSVFSEVPICRIFYPFDKKTYKQEKTWNATFIHNLRVNYVMKGNAMPSLILIEYLIS